MLTRRFAVHINRSLVWLLGIVIEKTDFASLRSFPCVVVKKTFQVTCRDPETEVYLILSRAGILETPKDIDDFTICPTHRSNLGTGVGGFVVPLVDVECLKKCTAMVKVGFSRFQKPIGELASVYPIQLVSNLPLFSAKNNWELFNRLPKIQTEAAFSILMSEHFVSFPPSGGTRN